MLRAPQTVPDVKRLATPVRTVLAVADPEADRICTRARSFRAARAVTRSVPSSGVVTEIVFTRARFVNVTDVVDDVLPDHGASTSSCTDVSAVLSGYSDCETMSQSVSGTPSRR
jgi:hypothetical protein